MCATTSISLGTVGRYMVNISADFGDSSFHQHGLLFTSIQPVVFCCKRGRGAKLGRLALHEMSLV